MENAWSAYTKGGPIAIPTEAAVDSHEGTIAECMAVEVVKFKAGGEKCGGREKGDFPI